jgi:hypothetical protein
VYAMHHVVNNAVAARLDESTIIGFKCPDRQMGAVVARGLERG